MAARKPKQPRKKPPAASPPAEKPSPVPAEDDAAAIEALIAAGLAARPDANGNLPPGATHVLVEGPNGELRVQRRRFSAY